MHRMFHFRAGRASSLLSTMAASRRDLITMPLLGSSTQLMQSYEEPLALEKNQTPNRDCVTDGAPRADGYSSYRDAALFKGLATDEETRVFNEFEFLMPSAVTSLQVEVERARVAIERAIATGSPLAAFQAIYTLLENDRTTAFSLLKQDITRYLPLIYTPTIGEACVQWGTLLPRPMGIYLSGRRLNDGSVSCKDALSAWPFGRHGSKKTRTRIAVITDGARILGLGDLGAHGQGIPVGKSVVYGACGVDPDLILPVLLDVGCNNVGLRNSQFYVGERESRLKGQEYLDAMDKLVMGLRDSYGPKIVLHWEDIASYNSSMLLNRYREMGFRTFNDDIECTAVINLAALIGATKIKGVPALDQQTFLFFGAGQANLGCADLLLAYLISQGLDQEEARRKIWIMDSKGLVVDGREGVSPDKKRFSQSAFTLKQQGYNLTRLEDVVLAVEPTALIGAASVGKAFDHGVLAALKKVAEARGIRPIVFALSNPTSQAECDYASAFTECNAVFASGTQFPPIERPGLPPLVPSQANNCYVFPGIGLGLVSDPQERSTVDQKALLEAAFAISSLVNDEELASESILPKLTRLQEVALRVSRASGYCNAARQPLLCG